MDPMTTSVKFFLPIDGVDEFEGERSDLVKLINDLMGNKNVKILLSSRPIPVCEESFSRWPGLRSHDLTGGDIQKYARDHLSERLEQKPGKEWIALIDEITNRSNKSLDPLYI